LKTGARVVGLFLLFALLPFHGRWWIFSGLIGLLAVVAVVPFVVRRIRRLETSEQPIVDGIEALAVSVSALVLGFAALYESMAIHGNDFNGLHTKIDAVYFTVVTLSTVGYGDITATSQTGRLVVTFNIVFNLLFLGGAVRLLTHVGRERHLTLNEQRGTIPPEDEE
jgi:hypothetical protein